MLLLTTEFDDFHNCSLGHLFENIREQPRHPGIEGLKFRVKGSTL